MTEDKDTTTTLSTRVVRGALLIAFGSYSNVIVGFIANIILTRLLAPEYFGLFAYGIFFYSLLNLRNRIPVAFGFIQKKEITGELIGTHFLLSIFLALGTLIISGFLIPIIRMFGQDWRLIWIFISLVNIGIIDSLANTAHVMLDKELHFGKSSIISTIAFPISYIPAIILAINNAGVWSLLSQNATYALLFMIGIIWLSKRNVPHLWKLNWRFDRTIAKYLIKFGATVGVSSLSGMVIGQFDNFLIGTFIGMETLGFYDRAYRVAQWPSLLVTGIISKISIYIFARFQDDPERLNKSVTLSFWIITTLGLPLAISIFISAPDLLILLYTDKWLPSATYLRFLVIYSIAQPLIGNSGDLFIAAGQPKITARVTTMQALVLIIIGTLLTTYFGAIGTCVAVGITFLVGLLMIYFSIKRIVDINIWEIWGVPVLIAALTLLFYLLFSHIIEINTWDITFRVIGKFLFAGLFYVMVLIILKYNETIERCKYILKLLFSN